MSRNTNNKPTTNNTDCGYYCLHSSKFFIHSFIHSYLRTRFASQNPAPPFLFTSKIRVPDKQPSNINHDCMIIRLCHQNPKDSGEKKVMSVLSYFSLCVYVYILLFQMRFFSHRNSGPFFKRKPAAAESVA